MQKTARFIFVGMLIIIIAAILIIIKQHESTSLFNGRTDETDIEMLYPLVLPINSESYVNAKPLMNPKDQMQAGKTYLYRSDTEFIFAHCGEYVIICIDDADSQLLSEEYMAYDAISGVCTVTLSGKAYKGVCKTISRKTVICAGKDCEARINSVTIKE